MDVSDLARGPVEIWQWSKEQLMIVLPPMVKMPSKHVFSNLATHPHAHSDHVIDTKIQRPDPWLKWVQWVQWPHRPIKQVATSTTYHPVHQA
ncbi:hypothetical protein LguiB_006198 [Lonicera macranthoides]